MHEALLCALFKILPEEDDYGFDIEEKNKAIVVKSVRRGSSAEVRPDIHKYFSFGSYEYFNALKRYKTILLKSVSF